MQNFLICENFSPCEKQVNLLVGQNTLWKILLDILDIWGGQKVYLGMQNAWYHY